MSGAGTVREAVAVMEDVAALELADRWDSAHEEATLGEQVALALARWEETARPQAAELPRDVAPRGRRPEGQEVHCLGHGMNAEAT